MAFLNIYHVIAWEIDISSALNAAGGEIASVVEKASL